MSNTKSEFSEILNQIELHLQKALPQRADPFWIEQSFGDLPKAIQKEHFNTLLEPNYNLISLGGKRWRPLLLILCYQLAKQKYPEKALTEEQAYSITPLVEFVHTASLIHDDIEDNADLRRGKPSAHITYGLDTSLNAASWLYFEAPVCINNLEVATEIKFNLYQVYTNELRKLHLGQAMDIYWHRNPEIFPAEQEYFSMVKNKTGTLASLAAKTGCIAGGMSLEEADKYGDIASNMGIGFQIIDDVINLTTGNAGKKRGDDIVEGKKSLPIILHTKSIPDDKNTISEFMKSASKEGIDSPSVEQCISLLKTSYSIEKAAKEGSKIIYDNSPLFLSDKISSLFISMIPEAFK